MATAVRVQRVYAEAPTDSITLTWSQQPTEGNLLLGMFYFGAVAPTAVVVPAGWTMAPGSLTTAGNACSGIMYRIAGPAEPMTATVTTPGDPGNGLFLVGQEWDNIDRANPLDQAASSFGGATLTSLTVGPTAMTDTAEELCIAVVAVASSSGGTFNSTWTNGFVSLETTEPRITVAAKQTTATEQVSTTESWSGTGSAYPRGSLATFRIAAPTGPVPHTGAVAGTTTRVGSATGVAPTAPFGPPQNLVAVVEGTAVNLSWDPSPDPATAYDIERDGIIVARVPASQTTYADTNRPNGMYSYRVRGVR